MAASYKRVWLLATYIYCRQRRKVGVEYSLREFRDWYVHQYFKKNLKRPEVGRRDHSKPYGFGNIDLIERFDNICERNERCGNPGRTAREVVAHFPNGEKRTFPTKHEAAAVLGVSEKTIFNHCNGRTKAPFKFGPGAGKVQVRFSWLSSPSGNTKKTR